MGKSFFGLLAIVTTVLATAPQDASAQPWTNGYYGTPSFRIGQDPQIRSARAVVAELDQAINRVEGRISRLRDEIQPLRQRKERAEQRKANLQNQLGNIRQELGQMRERLQNTKNQIQQARQSKQQLASQTEGIRNAFQAARSNTQGARQALNQANRQVEQADTRLKQARAEKKAAVDACVATGSTQQQCQQNQAVKRAQRKVNRMKNQKDQAVAAQSAAQTAFNNAKAAFDAAKTALDNHQAAVADATQRVQNLQNRKAQIESNIASKQQERQQKKGELDQTDARIQNLVAQIAPLRQNLQQARNRLERRQNERAAAAQAHQAARQALIRRVKNVNANAYSSAVGDGASDGSFLAQREGESYGQRDGQLDGDAAGTAAGQQREYNAGYADGQVLGQQQADAEGRRVGWPIGRREGNIIAATRDGERDGTIRAQNSDAAAVGTAQGNEAGMNRAIRTGDQRGTPVGQQQGIDKYESAPLQATELQGQFGGTFDYNVPGYPGSANVNNNAGQCNNYPREVVKQACFDGYNYGYYNSSENVFYQQIEGYYRNAYSSAYSEAERNALSRYYQASYDAGKEDGRVSAYNQYFPVYREQYREEARNQFSQNPDKDSDEYKSTYADVEARTYAAVYEQIRQAAYNEAEQRTFDANIDEQTDIFRRRRLAQVEELYENHAVLQYGSSTITDTGISGVASQDGVFQPGETYVFSMTVKNYGKAAAEGVSVTLRSGETATLPTLPAQSEVTIVGAAKGTLQGSINQSVTPGFGLTLAATSSDPVQKRHYTRADQNLLTSDGKRFTLSYPLSIAGLSFGGQVVVSEEQTLGGALRNHSSRKYDGPLEVKLSFNLGDQFITSEFNTLDTLDNNSGLTGAKVRIQGEDNAYRGIRISATVSKNGVVLGTSVRPLSGYAMIRYARKSDNTPIVVAKSSENLDSLSYAIRELGGPEAVSIVDMSLNGSTNRSLLRNGLDKKTVVVLDTQPYALATDLKYAVEKSTKSVFFFSDDRDMGLEALKRATGLFAHSFSLPGDFRGAGNLGLVATNQFAHGSLEGTSRFAQVRMSSLKEATEFAPYLKYTHVELAQQFDRHLNKRTWLRPTDHVAKLLQVATYTVVEDIVKVNEVYERDDRPRKWRKFLEKGDDLFMRQFDDVKHNSLGRYILGYFLDRVWDEARSDNDPIDDRTTFRFGRAGNSVLDDIKDDSADWLDDNHEDFYDDLDVDQIDQYIPIQL